MTEPTNNPYLPPASDAPAPPAASPGWDGVVATVLGGARLYRAHFKQILPIVLVAYGPLEVLLALLRARPDDGAWASRTEFLLTELVGCMVTPAILYAIVETQRTGQDPGFGASIRYGQARWGETVGATLLAGIFTVLGLLALIVPGLVLAVRYSFTNEVVALERASFQGPLKRSAMIVRGNGWRLFATWLLAIAPTIGLSILKAFVLPDESAPLPTILVNVASDILGVLLTCTGLVAYVALAHGGRPEWLQTVRWAPAPTPAAPAPAVV